jgi:hypothetical protein
MINQMMREKLARSLSGRPCACGKRNIDEGLTCQQIVNESVSQETRENVNASVIIADYVLKCQKCNERHLATCEEFVSLESLKNC